MKPNGLWLSPSGSVSVSRSCPLGSYTAVDEQCSTDVASG